MQEMYQEAAQTLHSIRDFVRWGASTFRAAGLFYGHGTDNALDEAAALVLFALHMPGDLAEGYWDSRLTPREKQAVLALLERRLRERRPAAYLTGEAWFAGLCFGVDERVLVPRSPIAELIEAGFEPWLDASRPVRRILDVGTGSACIAIACAYAFPDAEVDAVDISAAALEVARDNVARHHLQDRVHLLESDLLDGVTGRGSYDLIVSNPPYVPETELAELPPEYGHEPALGLAAGPDGLDCVLRILKGAARLLSEHGLLVVEVGAQAAALEQRMPGWPFLWVDFSRGGEGVFILSAAQLRQVQGLGQLG